MPRTGSQLRYLEVGVEEITTDLLKARLDSAGPLVMLQSKDSFIVKIFTRNEIDVSHRHDGLGISFRVIGRQRES